MNFSEPLWVAALFTTDEKCHLWNWGLVELHIITDGLMALAYFSVLLPLSFLARRPNEQPFSRLILLFSGFMTACGMAHLTEIWTFWHPDIWILSILKLMGAVLLLAIMFQLMSVVPQSILTWARAAERSPTVQKALPPGETRNQFLVQAFPDLLIRLRRDGIILDLQNGGNAPLLIPERVLVGSSIIEVLPVEQALLHMTHVQRALQTRELQVHEYQLRVDDEVQFGEVRSVPCGDDEVLMIVRDTTKRQRQEIELELQSTIVTNMAQGVCIVRVSDGIIAYANPKFEQIFGYQVGELKGRHVSILNYEDEGEINCAKFHEVMARGECTQEALSVRKDGTCFWCQTTMSGFRHPDYCTMLIVVQQDISERKRAAEALQASLAEKEATLEVLLKEVHHRVKNNLGVIDGLLQMQARRSPNPQITEALSESRNRITSIALIHEKLYRSKDLAKINFAHYIEDLTSHLFASYKVDSGCISLKTRVDDIKLDIDRAIPCGLIINELISNALKYAFKGCQKGEIEVSFLQHPNHTFSLTIQDNGVGISRDFNFEKPKTLGISLIKGLVKQLQGSLDISSEVGTKFVVTFSRG
ncbi:MAG: histidine kinase dimerization/phosphoacceptor domain -containing protein [Synechococcales bacterium]|nr:histidine kinase dimerization/phosphoacceptor domain -containing protein [Synechococcales bacterium]